MKKGTRIKDLELTEFSYIENCVIESKLNREEANSIFYHGMQDRKE